MSREIKRIAYRRIRVLFTLAKQIIHERPDLADRYVEIARRIAMKARIHLPKEFRLLLCRHCTRREPHVTITCLRCGGHIRIPLRRKMRDAHKY